MFLCWVWFFSVPSQEIGWEERLRRDLFSVEWDVKPCCISISIANESVPKIIINDTIIFFSETAISILLISNYNSFLVLFDKIAFVYF